MSYNDHKGKEGTKIQTCCAKRNGGWCKPETTTVCITHPGAARPTRMGRNAALTAKALLEAQRGIAARSQSEIRVVPRCNFTSVPFRGTGVFRFVPRIQQSIKEGTGY